jgi:hypothetical protein
MQPTAYEFQLFFLAIPLRRLIRMRDTRFETLYFTADPHVGQALSNALTQ